MNLNTCWLSHSVIEMSWPVQPHLSLWEGLNAIYWHVSRWCLQLGKVMCTRYPDQVGGHKPCEPEFGNVHMSPFGTVFVLPRRCPLGVTRWHRGHPGLSPKGSLSKWSGECHPIDWFCWNTIGPPEWEYEATGSVVWVRCTNLSRVYNLSIAAPVDMDPVRSRSQYGSKVIITWIINNPGSMMKEVGLFLCDHKRITAVSWIPKLVDVYSVMWWSRVKIKLLVVRWSLRYC